MPVTTETAAPYAPSSAMIDLIERHRSRGLPHPITAETLGRAGISESLIPRTLYALQTLDLIDENGRPTPIFESIRVAPENEYKKRLEDWLKGAYADVFSFVDPMNDGETRIRDAFRTYNPVGQQPRMVTLFQGLCSAAGLMPEKPPVVRVTGNVRSGPASVSGHVTTRAVHKANPKTAPKNRGLPPAITGLLESLPDAGTGWTAEDRQKFMTTFGSVLDFCYPVSTEE